MPDELMRLLSGLYRFHRYINIINYRDLRLTKVKLSQTNRKFVCSQGESKMNEMVRIQVKPSPFLHRRALHSTIARSTAALWPAITVCPLALKFTGSYNLALLQLQHKLPKYWRI